jgi:hypothetical protein
MGGAITRLKPGEKEMKSPLGLVGVLNTVVTATASAR